MKRKHKTTGCAKFFLMIIILAPLAYLGASYFNGQDGIQNIKNLFGGSGQKTEVSANADANELRDEIRDLQKEVESLEKENRRLRSDLEDCQSSETQ